MKKTQNVYAFIDSQNLNLAICDLGWKLDFRKFRVYLESKYKVNKAFLFLGYVKENQYLYKNLESYGYKLVFKPTLGSNGIIKGNCDAELVMHCILNKDNFEKAVVVSSDGDFYCLLEFLEEQQKLLKLLTPSLNYSSLLKRFARYIVPVPLFKHKVEYRKREAFPRHG